MTSWLHVSFLSLTTWQLTYKQTWVTYEWTDNTCFVIWINMHISHRYTSPFFDKRNSRWSIQELHNLFPVTQTNRYKLNHYLYPLRMVAWRDKHKSYLYFSSLFTDKHFWEEDEAPVSHVHLSFSHRHTNRRDYPGGAAHPYNHPWYYNLLKQIPYHNNGYVCPCGISISQITVF